MTSRLIHKTARVRAAGAPAVEPKKSKTPPRVGRGIERPVSRGGREITTRDHGDAAALQRVREDAARESQ